MSLLETLESNIVAQLQTISYLQTANGGTARGVASAKELLNLSTVTPPAALVCFAGSVAKENRVQGRAVQEITYQWDIFTLATSFSTAGEGRLGAGSYQIHDDIFTALEGFGVSVSPISKLFFVGDRFLEILPNALVYISSWRNTLPRIGN